MPNPIDLTALVETPSTIVTGACDGSVIPVNQLDDHIRLTRQYMKGWCGVEHDLATGQHKIPRGNTAARPAAPVTGQLYENTQTGVLELWNGSAWESANLANYVLVGEVFS